MEDSEKKFVFPVLAWSLFRAFLELLSAKDLFIILYESFFNSKHTIATLDITGMNTLGFPSLSLAGLVLFSQISLTYINANYSLFPLQFSYILTLQALFGAAITATCSYLRILPNSAYIFAAFSGTAGAISLHRLNKQSNLGIFNAQSVKKLINKPVFNKKDKQEKELSKAAKKLLNEVGKDTKIVTAAVDKVLKKFQGPGFMKLILFLAAFVGLALSLFPAISNAMFNSALDAFNQSEISRLLNMKFQINEYSSSCVAVLAIINLCQSFATFLAVYLRNYEYLWATTEAAFFGVFCAVFFYWTQKLISFMFDDDGFEEMLRLSWATKYGICYGWYGVQMWLLWPNSLQIED